MKTDYNFWKKWKEKTPLEQKTIEAVEKAREFVIKSVPEQALVSIYIKGSFVRRELSEGGDVDVVPIVTKNKYESAVFDVNDEDISPCIVVPLSLWEFRHNRLYTKPNHIPDLRAKPDRLLKKLDECRLIYGEPLNPNKFPIRNNKQVLREDIERFRKGFVLLYEKGEIEFSSLTKEVFWLVELEQSLKGIKVDGSFRGIDMAVGNKDHIIHDAYRYRLNPTKTKSEERKFASKLKDYLERLEREYIKGG